MLAVMPPALAALRERGLACARDGDLHGAYAIAEEACALARQLGDDGIYDLWVCNRARAAIELRRGESELPTLREILMRHGSGAVGWHASYHLARYYELAKDARKSLFYARIALDRARELGEDEWVRGSRNQMGSALLALSRSEEASSEYHAALAGGRSSDAERGVILGNLGYCLVLKKRLREGRRDLLESLRLLRDRSQSAELRTRLDLSFASLEVGRYGMAERHARRGLVLGRALGEEESVKNALYLLGEALQLSGREAEARAAFGALGQEFYPDQPYVATFLLAVDVRRVINLRA